MKRLTTSRAMEAMENIDMGCGWSIWDAAQKKMTLEFKRGERILHSATPDSHTFLTTKI
jgi:hypothetical protein